MKNKRFVGLDSYTIEFNNRDEMAKWIAKNEYKWAWHEIFIENGLCLGIKKIRRVY